MYRNVLPLNMPNQIAAGDDDDSSGAADTIDNHHHHIHYETHETQETHENGADGVGCFVEDATSDTVYVTGSVGPKISIQPCENSSLLTLSFRGQLYEFDSVTPDKAQAVLLLLGGCELPSGSQCAEIASQNQRDTAEYAARSSQPQRAASLSRFRQKRKERCFDKKVRYIIRQEVAHRMHRNKGQFTSPKKQEGASSWGNVQESGQDDDQLETSCNHCGKSSKSTPMMRRGPSGPRSLCNACGLFWANRGILRDLSKRNQEPSVAPAGQQDNKCILPHLFAPDDQADGEGNKSDYPIAIPVHNNLVALSDNDNPALMTDPGAFC